MFVLVLILAWYFTDVSKRFEFYKRISMVAVPQNVLRYQCTRRSIRVSVSLVFNWRISMLKIVLTYQCI